MNKQIIETEFAPKPIGPYSQAILIDDILYISGQIPLDPFSGNMVDSSYPIATKQVMDNLMAILAAAQMKTEHIVKCSIFIKDMNEFPAVNAVYGSYFDDLEAYPVRETIEVSNLPKGALVEISAIAQR